MRKRGRGEGGAVWIATARRCLRRCNFHFIFALTSEANFDLLSAQASGKAVKIRRGRAAVSDRLRVRKPLAG